MRGTTNEQKLIDICFELALTARDWKDFQKKSREEIAEWVTDQLNKCGFPTKSIGSSWGVLTNKLEVE